MEPQPRQGRALYVPAPSPPSPPSLSSQPPSDTLPADDFFVGIGDINSAFLPKVQPLAPAVPATPPPPPPPTDDSSRAFPKGAYLEMLMAASKADEKERKRASRARKRTPGVSADTDTEDSDTSDSDSDDDEDEAEAEAETGEGEAKEGEAGGGETGEGEAGEGEADGGEAGEDAPEEPSMVISPDEGSVAGDAEDDNLAELAKEEILEANTLALEAQVEERPLAKKQEELMEAEPAEGSANGGEAAAATEQKAENGSASAEPKPKREKVVRRALLKDKDRELLRVRKVRRLEFSQLRAALNMLCLRRSWSSCITDSTRPSTRGRRSRRA